MERVPRHPAERRNPPSKAAIGNIIPPRHVAEHSRDNASISNVFWQVRLLARVGLQKGVPGIPAWVDPFQPNALGRTNVSHVLGTAFLSWLVAQPPEKVLVVRLQSRRALNLRKRAQAPLDASWVVPLAVLLVGRAADPHATLLNVTPA